MTTKEAQEEFKEILMYGYKRGNEDTTLSAKQLVLELSEKMKKILAEREATVKDSIHK